MQKVEPSKWGVSKVMKREKNQKSIKREQTFMFRHVTGNEKYGVLQPITQNKARVK